MKRSTLFLLCLAATCVLAALPMSSRATDFKYKENTDSTSCCGNNHGCSGCVDWVAGAQPLPICSGSYRDSQDVDLISAVEEQSGNLIKTGTEDLLCYVWAGCVRGFTSHGEECKDSQSDPGVYACHPAQDGDMRCAPCDRGTEFDANRTSDLLEGGTEE